MNKNLGTQEISKEALQLLLGVLKDEYKAFYFYRAGKSWFSFKGYTIAAEFCNNESDDESKHAKIIEKYIVDWNVIPSLPSIEAVDADFENPVDFLKKAYELEFNLYEKYEIVAEKLLKLGEIGAWNFVQQFIQIQNDSVIEYSDKLNIVDGMNADSKFEMLSIEEQVFK